MTAVLLDSIMRDPLRVAHPSECFHCGEEVTAGSSWTLAIDGALRDFCCVGCLAVAEAIIAQGLTEFYRRRTATVRPAPLRADDYARLAALDKPNVQASFAIDNAEERTANLIISDLSCVACAWLVETRLARIPGVVHCFVSYAARRAELTWRPSDVSLSTILAAAQELGFAVAPFDPARANSQLEAEFVAELRRFGIAALCAMQVMMIATALYFDGETHAGRQYGSVLDWISFSFTLPVITYCAAPFLRGARRAMRLGTVTMDIPIVFGLLLAFTGSAWALCWGQGEVYFDSITMFVFLLLGSRLLEINAQRRAARYLEGLYRIEPMPVARIAAHGQKRAEEWALASELAVGDTVRIAAGAVIPIDGIVRNGQSTVDERVLTGESSPCRKGPAARVVSGSTNIDSPLDVEVTAVGQHTVLAQIAELAAHAAVLAPRLTRTDRVAAYFVWLVLALAAITIFVHGVWRGDPWLAPTVAVLVISCPCALALAIPMAVNSALANLLKCGVLVLKPSALTALANARAVVFDKTGTLTTGDLTLSGVQLLREPPGCDPLAMAASLAHHSTHSIGAALQPAYRGERYALTDISNRIGYGVSGCAPDGVRYWLGSSRYLREAGLAPIITPQPGTIDEKISYLADSNGVIARFAFADTVRSEAPAVIDYFKCLQVVPTLLSGDHAGVVDRVAQRVGVVDARADCTPSDKLTAISALVETTPGVVAVGDGINDAPMLARADVAVTLGAASAYAKLNADIVLLESGLGGLVIAHRVARRMVAIGRQNQYWAVIYNVIALPLALAGLVAPWIAALLMASSSLLVVANASRVARGV